jgi:hypothetical protein
MSKFMRFNKRRSGAALQEAMVAMLIVGAVLVSIAQVLAMAASQRRNSMQRMIATREVGNVMEDLMTRPWEDLTPERLANTPLSELCRRHIPEARLRIDVTGEGDSEAGRRIDIQLDWPTASAQRGAPVRLVAWRFHDEESAE